MPEHYPTLKQLELRRLETSARDLPVEALRALSDLMVLIVRGERMTRKEARDA